MSASDNLQRAQFKVGDKVYLKTRAGNVGKVLHEVVGDSFAAAHPEYHAVRKVGGKTGHLHRVEGLVPVKK